MYSNFCNRLFQFTILLFVIFSFITARVYGKSLKFSNETGEILLPQEFISNTNFILSSQPTQNENVWNKFIRENGEWTAMFDKYTSSPRRAFGKPIRIQGYDNITKTNVREVAMKFLNNYAAVLNINPLDLQLQRATLVNGIWYVSFKQYYKGIEVLLSEIELRIHLNGNIFAFGSLFYKDINIDTKPKLTTSDISLKAIDGIKFYKNKDFIQTSEKLYILPYRTFTPNPSSKAINQNIDYKLVYRADINTSEPIGKFIAYIDANNGDVLWRRNQVINVASQVEAKGGIKWRFPTDTVSFVPFPEQYITIGGTRYTTDKNGRIQLDISGQQSVNAKFEGPWAKIFVYDSANMYYTDSLKPGGKLTLIYDDSKAHLYERNLFYHTNVIHNYITNLDTAFKGMDFQMTVIIQFQGQGTNAMSAGDTIVFIGAGNTDMPFAASASILYHEYGHSVNYFLYTQEGAQDGMVNSTCNEGTADVMSAMLIDSPEVGKGATPTGNIRNIKNNNIFPDSVSKESHHDGLILAGAFWDLRELTSLDVCRKLSHFAKYGLPDDPELSIAFGEWFIETLVADDNDGDLTNGTPHFNEIVEAFNKHGIGTDLYMTTTFSHAPFDDTQELINPYPIEFELSGVQLPGGKPDSVNLIYSVNNFSSFNIVAATEFEPNKYKVDIPAQERGSQVKYYITAYDRIAKKTIRFSNDMMSLKPFDFLVGFNSNYYRNFEIDDGWTVGTSGDNATSGRWELAIPTEVIISGLGLTQPGSGHSDVGKKCFVTGAFGSPYNISQYWTNGITSLISPNYKLQGLDKPVLKFYSWTFDYPIFPLPGSQPSFKIYISTSNGMSWTLVDEFKESSRKWVKSTYLLDKYYNSIDSLKVKFVANIISSGGFPLYYYEALMDDFEILSLTDLTSVYSDDYNLTEDIFIFPNPMSDEITIRLNKLQQIPDLFSITDVLGNEIFKADKEYFLKNNGFIYWNRINKYGMRCPAGLYLLKLNIKDKIITKSIIVN